MSGPLYRHMGCCIDESPAAALALAHARALSGAGQARLSLVHVAPHPLVFGSGDASTVPSPEDISSTERAWLDARAREVPGATPVFLQGLAGPEICRWAATSEVDLLVAGAGGGALATVMLGNVTRHLVDHAPCPVLVVRQSARRQMVHEPTATEVSP